MFNKSLAIDKELGRKLGMANAYGNMGIVYGAQGDLDKALDMFNKSLVIDKELGRKLGMANAYVNMGIVCRIQGDLDKACKFWQTSLAFYKFLGVKDRISLLENRIKKSCEESEDKIDN